MELKIVEQEYFNGLKCDFYSSSNEIWMTRNQIGQALEYIEPQRSICKIHKRHKERLDKFSVVVTLGGTDNKLHETVIYSAKGIYEICRWSRQPKADEFFDWVYEVLERIRTNRLLLIDESIYEALKKNNSANKEKVADQIKKINSDIDCKLSLINKAENILKYKNEVNIVPLLEELSRNNNTSLRSLYRLLKNYRDNPESILPKPRSNKGKHHAIDPELSQLAISLYKQQKMMDKYKVYYKIKGIAEKKNLLMCSRSTLYRILDNKKK